MMIWAAKSNSMTGTVVTGTNEVRLGSVGGVVIAELGRDVVDTELLAPATVVEGDCVLLAGVVVVGATVVDVVVAVLSMAAGLLETRNHRTPSGSSDRIPHSASLNRFTDT
jgi:hypothetical protein